MGHSRKPTSKEITILERIFIHLQFLLRKSFMRVFLKNRKEKQNKKKEVKAVLYTWIIEKLFVDRIACAYILFYIILYIFTIP